MPSLEPNSQLKVCMFGYGGSRALGIGVRHICVVGFGGFRAKRVGKMSPRNW